MGQLFPRFAMNLFQVVAYDDKIYISWIIVSMKQQYLLRLNVDEAVEVSCYLLSPSSCE